MQPLDLKLTDAARAAIDNFMSGLDYDEGVPCLTAMETAVAAAEALDPAIDALIADVRSLGEWRELAGGLVPTVGPAVLAAIR